jgi:hypothetical protein
MTLSLVKDIADSVVNTVNWVVGEITHNLSTTYELAGHQYKTVVEPHLHDLVTKVQNLDVKALLEDAKTFIQSDFGISAALLGGSIGCIVGSRQVENKVASVCLVIAGVAAMALSAVMLFKPELVHAPIAASIPAQGGI